MTLSEFKAWFEGFTENIEKVPNQKQWTRIKQKMKGVNDIPTTERVFIDRYWPRYREFWGSNYVWQSDTTGGSIKQQSTTNAPVELYSAAQAFQDLGRAEAQAMG